MKAYIDDSRAGEDVLVLGGYIASDRQWDEFSAAWQEKLDHAGLDEFKMSSMPQNETHITGYFYKSIEKYVSLSVVCVVDISSLRKICSEYGLGKPSSDPYWLAIKALVNVIAQDQSKLGLNEPVEFVFDEDGQSEKIKSVWSLLLDSLPEKERRNTGATPTWQKSHLAIPLQSADLGMWWYRKQFLEIGRIDGLPFPWPTERDILRELITYDEAAIRREFIHSSI